MNITGSSGTLDTPQPCEYCGHSLMHPQWIRVDRDWHVPVCGPCLAAMDAQFTEENVICFAIIVVGVHQGRLNQEARMR